MHQATQCTWCKHILRGGPVHCLAFPYGVPEEVLRNEVQHDRVLEGQEGEYVRELDEGAPPGEEGPFEPWADGDAPS